MATILVIDPSRVIRDTLKERLEYEGYTVEVAADTIAGVSVYSKNLFDLVICGQPDSPIRISTPWIRLSHDTSPESAVLAMQQGAIDFLTKPVNMNRLLDAVRRGLAATPRIQAPEAQATERGRSNPEINTAEVSVRQVRPKAQVSPITPAARS